VVLLRVQVRGEVVQDPMVAWAERLRGRFEPEKAGLQQVQFDETIMTNFVHSCYERQHEQLQLLHTHLPKVQAIG